MEIINQLVSIPSCYLYKDSYEKGIIMENIYVHNIFQEGLLQYILNI